MKERRLDFNEAVALVVFAKAALEYNFHFPMSTEETTYFYSALDIETAKMMGGGLGSYLAAPFDFYSKHPWYISVLEQYGEAVDTVVDTGEIAKLVNKNLGANMGSFIVLEGPDRIGKTTQAWKLGEALAEDRKVLYTREPGGSVAGEKIREIVLGDAELAPLAAMYLMLADRIEHMEKVVKPALADGITVVCDRWELSTLVYQSFSVFNGRKIPLEFTTMIQRARMGVIPDVTLVLTANEPYVASSVNHFDDMSFDKLNSKYLKEASRCDFPTQIVPVDGLSVTEVTDLLLQQVMRFI